MNENSMCFWWPPVRDIPSVLMPATRIIEVGHRALFAMLDGESLPERWESALHAAGAELGYPLFLRTNLMSGKHRYVETCYVPSAETLLAHVYRVVEENDMAIMEPLYHALVLRQYIPLEAAFTAFRGLPIAVERRYFVDGGTVECHHPYWPEQAIKQAWHHVPPLPGDWRERLARQNMESETEVALLSQQAQALGTALGGRWSVDFALSQDGHWWFIDAARANDSWHPDCAVHGAEVR